jgi:hypothetical protein
MKCSLLFAILFLSSCLGSPRIIYQKYASDQDLYKSCLAFLSGENFSATSKDSAILQELQSTASQQSMDSYFTGEIVFDLVTKEGRHLQLDRFGRIEYFRSMPVTLNAKVGMEFLCAEHIRWIVEKKFNETAAIVKKDPIASTSRERLEENLKEYLRFSEAVRNKNQIVRNFLFIQLSPYLAGDKGLPISPCGFSGKMREPITIAVKDLEDYNTRLAWASLIQTITAYELGFTLAGYCN